MAQNNHQDNAERMGRLEARLDEVFREIEDMKETRREMNITIMSALEKLDSRTRMLEKHVWLAVGGLAMLQIALSTFK